MAVDKFSNVYMNDMSNYRAMLWRKNASTGIRAVGTGINGNTSSTIGTTIGIAVDSQGNIYISDQHNNRIMMWTPNATNGTCLASNGVRGNSSQNLNDPYGIYIDQLRLHLYICDRANHRIQRYTIGVSGNGTTVAGGNGAGSVSDQLNSSHAVCVSKKTGAIYLADLLNHRIQRWGVDATSGVTIAGVTGVSGTAANLLSYPAGVALSLNETFVYVSDNNNHRVQRFELI